MKDKLLYSLIESTGLKFITGHNALVGEYRGFDLTITEVNNIYYIYFPVRLTTEFDLNQMNMYLKNLTKEFKGINYASYNNSAIQLQYSPKSSSMKSSDTMLSILNALVSTSENNLLAKCCSLCAEENPVTPFLLKGVIIPCCKNCQFEIKNSIAEQQNEFKSKNNNIIGGIVGAFIGALIGSALWIGISQMGYIAAIAGLAIAVCSIKGYQFLGGKLNMSGIVITSIITIAMVYISSHISLALEIYSAFKNDYAITFFDAFKSVPDFLSEPEVKNGFIKDLVIGYILTVVGSFSYFRKAYHQANYHIEAEEIDY